MKSNALLLLVASAAASVEREEPYLGSYQVHPECWVRANFWYIAAASCHSDFLNLFYQMWESQWTIGCLLGRKLIGWFPPPPPYYMCIRGRSPKPKPWIYSSLAGGDSYQHLKFSYLLFLYLDLWTGTFHFTPWKCIWNIWTLNERENTKCKALLTRYSRELTSQ